MLRGAARGAQRRVAVVGWVHGPGGGGGLARAWVVGRSARPIQLYRDGVRPLTDRLGARTDALDLATCANDLIDLGTGSSHLGHPCSADQLSRAGL
jgi:hypothetical protein